jgi:hypothetical protein
MIDPGLGHLLRHRPADDVTWRQLVHEPLTAIVAEDRPVTSQSLREKRTRHRRMVQSRRVELHELDVRHGDPRSQPHRDPVAGRLGRVRRH